MGLKNENVHFYAMPCDWCRQDFTPPRPWSRFCRDECKKAFQKEALRVGSEVLRKKSGGMHFGKVDSSPQLKRLLRILEDIKTGTTKELAYMAGLQNIATWVSALRKNGYVIDCEYKGTTNSGSKIYEYTYRGNNGTN